MAELTLQAVSKVFDDGTAAVRDVDLHCADGEFVVLVGPSGCGKSTLLRMIAGLESVSSGTIRIGDRLVNELPPQARDTAMVFQNYALYPHMTVRGNLAFPLRVGGIARTAIDTRVTEVAELLELDALLERRPGELSGGQRQRVAMGRALVREPAVFLMDEPLSNLDARLRVQMRGEITALQRRLATTTLYVTHDQVEAMTMGDRLAVLNRGRLQQVGTPEAIYRSPANVFVATFIGSPAMNLFVVHPQRDAEGTFIRLGQLQIPVPDAVMHGTTREGEASALLCGVRPEAFTLPGDAASAAGLTARVERVELLGHEQIVHCRAEIESLSQQGIDAVIDGTFSPWSPATVAPETHGQFVARLGTDVALRSGASVTFGIDAGALHFFALNGDSVSAERSEVRVD